MVIGEVVSDGVESLGYGVGVDYCYDWNVELVGNVGC